MCTDFSLKAAAGTPPAVSATAQERLDDLVRLRRERDRLAREGALPRVAEPAETAG
ncbi:MULTISPECIES: hypothetical protein [Mumia]|uniref:Uncharacterized protein n=1 Tax=Mumia xiangluensis TaxID=1678900 RepID=A0ABW1QIL5_9ACTN|nr:MULTISPECIES: hypothetical protein [Mumia]